MPVTNRRAARTAVRAFVVPMATAGWLTVAVPQAAAHTELASSSPSDGATLDRLPERVTLTFSDEMTREYARIAVTVPDGSSTRTSGSSVTTGEPRVEGKSVTLALEPSSPGGRYTVGYRVVSADGHPVSGSYTFIVKTASGASASAASPTRPADTSASSPATAAVPDEASGSSSGVGSAVPAGAGALIVVGAGAYVACRKRAGHGG